MKILVTGSSGFIGSKVVDKLKEQKLEVIPFDIITGQDLNDTEQVNEAVFLSDIILHLAAQADLNEFDKKPAQGMNLNVACTERLARYCAKHKKHLIYISTCCVYGNQEELTTEKTLPNPSEIYAHSKLAGEHIIKGYGKNFKMPWTIIRVPTTHGEGMRSALAIRKFFEQAMKGEDITVHGDGLQTRSLTYIGDVVDAITDIVEGTKKYPDRVKNQIFNINQDNRVISAIGMANDIRRIVQDDTGIRSDIVHIEQRKGQTFKENISSQKIRYAIGWMPKVDWMDSLIRTYNWIKSLDN